MSIFMYKLYVYTHTHKEAENTNQGMISQAPLASNVSQDFPV